MIENILARTPIVTIIFLSALAVLIMALVAYRLRKPERNIFSKRQKRVFMPFFILGLLLSLAGGFLMYDGGMLGENTVSIARIMGIVGLVLIVSANSSLMAFRKH